MQWSAKNEHLLQNYSSIPLMAIRKVEILFTTNLLIRKLHVVIWNVAVSAKLSPRLNFV